jgi:Cu2+-exporting ATPase
MNAAALPADDNDVLAAERAEGGASRASDVLAGLDVLDDPLEMARYTRWQSGPAGERLAISSLQLSGLHCAACAGLIEAALRGTSGVREVQVSAAAQRASITWDAHTTRPSALFAAIRRAGYDAVPDAAAEARVLRQREARHMLWRLFVAAFCAMQVMMLAAPGYVAAAGDIAPDLRRLLGWGGWMLTLPVLVFSCGPFFRGAWRGLAAGRIGMDLPVALGILITFVASTGAAFAPGGLFGSEVYFDSLTMFVSFLLAARWLEMRARHAAAAELERSLARLPETAERVAADGSTSTVSVHRLRPGDHVRVALGQAVPADGTLLEGETQCDEALLQGESMPVPKRHGDELVAGSVNVGAPVLMRVQRVGPDTRFEGIVALMRSAAVQRPEAARLADRWAAPFLWAVLLLAAGGAAVWSVIDPGRAVWVAVSVLIVTCPCALSLAAPATLLAATRALARRGVLVQRLDAIETLAQVDRVFFDKTGTLTSDVPALQRSDLTAAGRRVFQGTYEALAVAAQLATWSRHPLARAVVHAQMQAQTQTQTQPRAQPHADGVLPAGPVPRSAGWCGFQEEAGRGVQARDAEGRCWRLGAPHWAAAAATGEGAATAAAVAVAGSGADLAPTPGNAADDATPHVCLSCDGVALAAFAFDGTLRPDAAATVAALQGDGVAVTLLSGDRGSRVHALAARLGIADAVADATPADKLAVLAAAQASGHRVAMVGDGINDAPAFARADVAIAMGQGALLARAGAGLVLLSGRPGDLLVARRTARRAVRIVRQNIVWAAVYNFTCVPLALAGWLPPWAAGLGMAASSLFVVGQALRVAR